MARYVVFLLDLANEKKRIVGNKVAFAPDASVHPTDAFVYRVVCDIEGKVVVSAARDGSTEIIATARWSDGKLADARQKAAQVPTGYQWSLVESALRKALARADRQPDAPADGVEDIAKLEASFVSRDNWRTEVDAGDARRAEWERGAAAADERYEARKKARPIALGVLLAVIAIGVIVFAVLRVSFRSWGAIGYVVFPLGLPFIYSGLLRVIDPSIPFVSSRTTRETASVGGRTQTVERYAGTTTSMFSRRAAAIFMSIGIALSIGGLVVAIAAPRDRKRADSVVAEPSRTHVPAPAPVTPPRPPAPPSIAERITHAASLGDALAIANPQLADPVVARALESFVTTKLRWSDVSTPTTTIARVEKDPIEERGKRLCATGTIDSIERTDLGGHKAYSGTLTTTDHDQLAFVAVGSTGELVKRSTAKLCGLVTAKTTVVSVIGMFDLPENEKPVVEQ